MSQNLFRARQGKTSRSSEINFLIDMYLIILNNRLLKILYLHIDLVFLAAQLMDIIGE